MTVLVLGIPSEPPVAAVVQAIQRCRGNVVMWNQRDILESAAELMLSPIDQSGHGELTGRLIAPGIDLNLGDLSGIYVRLTDNETLPELANIGADDPRREHADQVLDTLFALCSLSPACVVNRPSAPDENGSKPRQLQLIASRFATPPALVTDDPRGTRLLERTRADHLQVDQRRALDRHGTRRDRRRAAGVAASMSDTVSSTHRWPRCSRARFVLRSDDCHRGVG